MRSRVESLVTIWRVFPGRTPSTLCNGNTTIEDQQAHVSLLHPTAECPQLDEVEGREFGDDLLSVAWLTSLHPYKKDTTIGDQQAHVSLLHPAEECPQLDEVEGRELGDDFSSVAWPNSLHPV
jgi:hypothetical protein